MESLALKERFGSASAIHHWVQAWERAGFFLQLPTDREKMGPSACSRWTRMASRSRSS